MTALFHYEQTDSRILRDEEMSETRSKSLIWDDVVHTITNYSESPPIAIPVLNI